MTLCELDLSLSSVTLHPNGSVHTAFVENGGWHLYHDGEGNMEARASAGGSAITSRKVPVSALTPGEG